MTNEDIKNIIQVIGVKNIIIYFVVINLLGFLMMYLDKKKAIKGKWRISEKSLFVVTLLGGGIGTNIGMNLFRHKTKKMKFSIGFPTILIVEIILILVFLYSVYIKGY